MGTLIKHKASSLNITWWKQPILINSHTTKKITSLVHSFILSYFILRQFYRWQQNKVPINNKFVASENMWNVIEASAKVFHGFSLYSHLYSLHSHFLHFVHFLKTFENLIKDEENYKNKQNNSLQIIKYNCGNNFLLNNNKNTKSLFFSKCLVFS